MPGTMLSALQFYLTSSSPPYEADFFLLLHYSQDFPGGSLVKNPPANAGDSGSIPGLGRSLEKEMAAHPRILAWRIPWTERPGGLQSMGLQKSWT